VIAFPKTQSAQCPLTHAPAPAHEAQLLELGLKVIKSSNLADTGISREKLLLRGNFATKKAVSADFSKIA